jgi:hypothetical protein
MKHARENYNRIQDPAGKIAQDEPVFLLRAKDKVAPATLRAWGELHKIGGGDPLLSQMAYDHADLMEKWQEKNGSKSADL